MLYKIAVEVMATFLFVWVTWRLTQNKVWNTTDTTFELSCDRYLYLGRQALMEVTGKRSFSFTTYDQRPSFFGPKGNGSYLSEDYMHTVTKDPVKRTVTCRRNVDSGLYLLGYGPAVTIRIPVNSQSKCWSARRKWTSP